MFRQEPDLCGNHVALTRIKAREEFLVTLLHDTGRETPKRDLHLMAAVMQNSEIHREITEKLDRITESLLA